MKDNYQQTTSCNLQHWW